MIHTSLVGPGAASRRSVLIGTTGFLAASAFCLPGSANAHSAAATATRSATASAAGNILTTSDGAQIYYKDWGSGQPIVFSHGWPLSSDAFEDQMFFLASNGYRAIAADRRGHGRSSQPWNGNDMDTYADDLAELVGALDLKRAVHVGHSTGGGEVARYVGRHGTDRVAKLVLISAIPPIRLKTEANPLGAPIEAFNELRQQIHADRSAYWSELSLPFYGYNRPGANISEGVRAQFVLQCMMAGMPASYLGIKAQSETDFTADLKRIDVPTLVLHGEDDQLVPIADSAPLTASLVKGSELKVLAGAPHGMCTTRKDEINAALLSFVRGSA